MSSNYGCLHLIIALVIQLDNDVFLIRRSIITCWHLIIQYRFPSIICVLQCTRACKSTAEYVNWYAWVSEENAVRLFERRDDG